MAKWIATTQHAYYYAYIIKLAATAPCHHDSKWNSVQLLKCCENHNDQNIFVQAIQKYVHVKQSYGESLTNQL